MGWFNWLAPWLVHVVGLTINWLLHVVDPHGSIGEFNRLVRAIGSCRLVQVVASIGCVMWLVHVVDPNVFHWLFPLVSSIGWSI